jgi:hypothetical protein
VHLRAGGAQRAFDLVGRRLKAGNRRVGGRFADVEGRLRRFREAERRAAASSSRSTISGESSACRSIAPPSR